MAFPSKVLTDMTVGAQYLSDINEGFIADLKRGCTDCTPKDAECLTWLLISLNYKASVGVYDEESLRLYMQMMEIIGGSADLDMPPTVVSTPESITSSIINPVQFTANATPGSSPIVSYLWTQVSGSTATLQNANTPVLTVSNYGTGTSVFKVTVTDENDLTAEDTSSLIGTQIPLTGYWWQSNDGLPLTQSQILASNPFTFTQGGNLNIPFDVDEFAFFGFAYPSSQTTKTKYQDVSNPLNKGDIGGVDDLFGAVQITGSFKQHNTNYPTVQTTNLIIS